MYPAIGQKVTTKETVQAYYCGYGGLPYCAFEPGDTGIVAAVNVPCVLTNGVFHCVDFEKLGRTWRVAIRTHQMKKL